MEIFTSTTLQWPYLPGHPQLGNLSSGHSLCPLRYLRTFFTVVKLGQLHPPAQETTRVFWVFLISVSNISDQQFHQRCTHCLPPVAGSSTYLSKYNRTSRSLSSGPGRAKFTISSMRSLMAQSNCSGWLLARTSMNLRGGTRCVLTKRNPKRSN